MHLVNFGVIIVFIACFWIDSAIAQIPERVLFQPGSYAYGPYLVDKMRTVATVPLITTPINGLVSSEEPEDNETTVEPTVETNKTDTEADADNRTEWEKRFAIDSEEDNEIENEITDDTNDNTWGEAVSSIQWQIETVPYLAYHRNPLTHRIHVVPYEPGYAEEPEAFPVHQSMLNLWLSTLPCREQTQQQVKCASYYDSDPVIIEDKPSRLQLILGYPNGTWTSCYTNRWGQRMAQCPEAELFSAGSYAEIGIKDQPLVPIRSVGVFGGLFARQQLMDSAAQPRRGLRSVVSSPAPYPFIQQHQPYYAAIPYPPHTALSITYSRPIGSYAELYSKKINQNKKTVQDENISFDPDKEKDDDSQKFCKHCQTCQYCQSRQPCPSCGSADCEHEGTMKSPLCLLKKSPPPTKPKKTKTVTTPHHNHKQQSCNTKTEKEN
jgi:hypothetical protein